MDTTSVDTAGTPTQQQQEGYVQTTPQVTQEAIPTEHLEHHSQQQDTTQQPQQAAPEQIEQHPTAVEAETVFKQEEEQQQDCSILSPTLADILSDDRILRFYQCVKDIKTQGHPRQTAAMFFALCHALGDTVSFLKVPNMNKIMFRQEQQIFGVNIAGVQQEGIFQQSQPQPMSPAHMGTPTAPPQQNMAFAGGSAALVPHQTPQQDINHAHNDYYSNPMMDNSPQHLLQAALSAVHAQLNNNLHATQQQASHTLANQAGAPVLSKRRNTQDNKDGSKRTKKSSPRDKEYSVRRNEVIQDLLKVSDADLMHQANMVEDDVKLVIQGHERSTKLGVLSPIQRFAAFANLAAHYDCDFAPKNAGVYYNYEYFQLYLAYRDFELERQQQQQMEGGDPRPIMTQCRTEMEKVLVNTNWEAIRRRLTIGERICQVCGVLGRGFLLLSKQVSGRKLLHNFNTGEWLDFMREFRKPENQEVLHNLQAKYNPERFYGHTAVVAAAPMHIPAASPAHGENSNAPIRGEENNTTSVVDAQTAGQTVEALDHQKLAENIQNTIVETKPADVETAPQAENTPQVENAPQTDGALLAENAPQVEAVPQAETVAQMENATSNV